MDKRSVIKALAAMPLALGLGPARDEGEHEGDGVSTCVHAFIVAQKHYSPHRGL